MMFSLRPIPHAFAIALLSLSFLNPCYGQDDQYLVSMRTIANPANAMSPLGALSEFDLFSSRDRALLSSEMAKLIALDEAQKKDARKELPNAFPYDISGGQRRGLEKCRALLEVVSKGGKEGREAALWIRKILASFKYAYDYPIEKSRFEILPELPYYVLKGSHHMRLRAGEESDKGRRDPAPSTYWTPRANDGNVDLKAGFGRASAANVENDICLYNGPKDGWGAHPGFHVECAGRAYKFKLGDEIYSGPFNTRLYWLMGYNTTPIDRVEQIKVAYDRKILTEFHSRKHLELQFRLFGIPVIKHSVTQYSDPFTWIQYAALKDGRRISGSELKGLLLKHIPPGNPALKKYARPEAIPGNFRETFEAKIDHLAFVPGAIATDSDDIKSIGPWKYNDFEVASRREIRALLILSGWVSNYNMRWENTRLSFRRASKDADWELTHFLSDVGSGFGTATRALAFENNKVDEMLWRVTKPMRGGKVKLSGIQQNDINNDAFKALTFEDAQWMIRKIAGLSEKQIWDALGAAQMPAASRRLCFEKLLSRRIHMIRDFELAREFPSVVKRPINERFSFTPKETDGYGWDLQKIEDGKLIELKNTSED